MTDDAPDVTEIAKPDDLQARLHVELHLAASRLLDHVLSAVTEGEFADAIASGKASVELTVSLPRGDLNCVARYPAIREAPIQLFKVRMPREHGTVQ